LPRDAFSARLRIAIFDSGEGPEGLHQQSGLPEIAACLPSAFVARAAVWLESIDQPTTRRECTSRTTAQYILPSLVGCSMIR
jgi:hypothetical protein